MSEQRTSRRVLVVDDEPSVCAALESVLLLEGHVVKTVTKPERVLDEVARFAPEVVVLDVQMPRRSGVEISRDLREQFPHLAIILHTGKTAGEGDGLYADLVLEKGTVFTFLNALRKFLAEGKGARRG
jgi:DNA-binding response OmpR family regulator